MRRGFHHPGNCLIFNSAKIPVVPFEDNDVNPGILGRGLVEWLRERLLGTKFPVTDVVAEDWGYCVFIHRKPYWLYIGLAGESDFKYPESGLDEKVVKEFPLESVQWQLWVETEMGWVSRILGKDNRSQDAVELLSLVKQKLVAEGITIDG